ncbi:cancer-related nucleoside-triphosphatase isoform X2 [Latimeria chalumnae]|uniref:cancer-related nucleoside-triphosphatase isoform X2 n=1 Tax=Latimeria chalumnae TaxID=7897 RepID=UPI0006D93360|nr:PREDICTED: cancer-related nucleoside-triphosphatase isoform X2 [Latimeria chalumnae]|eukprot:XP_014341930.1 PREDICTED: cancer-related nucleoside-triphosphatase isoform X2 [Latimeria chalumnae]
MYKHVFLTGPPGVGKTTLIQKSTEALKSSGIPIDGFYTEEVRQGGRRIGFDVVTLFGKRGTLSRANLGGSIGHKVFIIDEIGRMELFSHSFIQAVRQILDGSETTVLGTIPIPKGKPLGLVEEIRSRRDVKVFSVTKENRGHILKDIVTAVQNCRK